MKDYKITMTGTFVAVANVKAKDEHLARELARQIAGSARLCEVQGASIDKTEVEVAEEKQQ